jgi:SpoVK/Ycf46/Vps4 family AAA+-type ATPase
MNSDDIERLFQAFVTKNEGLFHQVAQDIIEHEEQLNHHLVAAKLRAIVNSHSVHQNILPYRTQPIPRDNEKGFQLLEVKRPFSDWSDLIVSTELEERLREIPLEIKNRDILSNYGLKPRSKLLFYGPPGTGKTLCAKVLCSAIGYPLIVVKFESVVSSFLGETAANIRKIFDYIDKGKWVVLFDEFDIIGKKRDDPSEHGEIKRVVNNFMLMLEDYQGDSVLIAATNHPQLLDRGVWRRFDDIIQFGLPDKQLRARLYEKKLSVIPVDSAVDFDVFAGESEGFSGADIEQVAIRAMKKALLSKRKRVSKENIEEAILRQKEIVSVQEKV